MKAVVVEIKENKAAVLTDDGRVIAITNKEYEVGQIIQAKAPRMPIAKHLSVYAASAAAVVILGIGSWAYASPYTYVSVDVNPSIEYSVNRFDRVLHVKAVNDDGEEIIQQMDLEDLKNKTIEAALLMTVEQIAEVGYFTEDSEGGIVITTASENVEKADELAASLQQAVEEELDYSKEMVEVESYSVGLERVEEAKELGVTPGKLNLVEKLQASSADPTSVDINQWLDKSVKEIMKATKDNKKSLEAGDQAESSTVVNNSKAQTKEERAEQKQEKKTDKANSRLENQENTNDNSSDKKQSENSQGPGEQSKDNSSSGNRDKNILKDNNSKNNDKNNNKDVKINNGKDKTGNLDQTEQKQDEVTAAKEKKSKPNDAKNTKSNEKKNKEDSLAPDDNNITDTNTETDSNSTDGSSSEQNKSGSLKEEKNFSSSDEQPDASKADMNRGNESGSSSVVDQGRPDSGKANSHN